MRAEGNDLFVHKIRLVVTDSAFANLRAERSMTLLRIGGRSPMHITCDVHRYASILDMTNDLVEQYTTDTARSQHFYSTATQRPLPDEPPALWSVDRSKAIGSPQLRSPRPTKRLCWTYCLVRSVNRPKARRYTTRVVWRHAAHGRYQVPSNGQ